MNERYHIILKSYPEEQEEQLVLALAQKFHSSSDKMRRLLRNCPKKISKALPLAKAQLIQEHFSRLGIVSDIEVEPEELAPDIAPLTSHEEEAVHNATRENSASSSESIVETDGDEYSLPPTPADNVSIALQPQSTGYLKQFQSDAYLGFSYPMPHGASAPAARADHQQQHIAVLDRPIDDDVHELEKAIEAVETSQEPAPSSSSDTRLPTAPYDTTQKRADHPLNADATQLDADEIFLRLTQTTQKLRDLSTPSPATAPTTEEASYLTLSSKRRWGLQEQFFLAVLSPLLLICLAAILVLLLVLRPSLESAFSVQAHFPGETALHTINQYLINESLKHPENLTLLQDAIQVVRQAYAEQPISFVAIVDTEQNILSSWFNNSTEFKNSATEVVRRDELYQQSTTNFTLEDSQLHLSIMQHPISHPDNPLTTLGYVLVAWYQQGLNSSFQQLSASMLLILTLPVLLGVLIARRLGRRSSSNLRRLNQAVQALNQAHIEKPIDQGQNDEIGDLADSLERLRLNLKLALERLSQQGRN